MNSKKTRPSNQTIDELFDEYNWELDNYIESFVLRYGYIPKDPEGFDYPFCPPEIQDMSFKFWNDSHILKMDCLAHLFNELIRKF